MDNFWQLGDDLRGQVRVSEDHQWSVITSKLAELTVSKGERINHLESKPKERPENTSFQSISLDFKVNDAVDKISLLHGAYNTRSNISNHLNDVNSGSFKLKNVGSKFTGSNNSAKEINNNNISKTIGNLCVAGKNNNKNNCDSNNNGSVDKRFKTLPSAEMLPRNEVLGGYIFVCNNDTMQEDLKRQLFGLPPRYRDSVRAITPGLPLFLYNYTTHQLHGIFEAASFGGTNIDPTAWEDKKCKGESRFPAQVRIRMRKLCKALEEDAFRPVLHHYDGPKFRLELSIPETLELLDLCEQADM